MHARRAALAALAGATIALSLAAAPGELIRFEFDEPHMGTTFRIVLYASDAGSAASASSEAFDRIADLDRRLTDYGEDSELMRACRQAVGRQLPVSRDVFRVLDAAHRLAERTGGAFDVTAGALTRLWRHARRQGTRPDPRELSEARAASGYRQMRLDRDQRTLRLERSGVRLDVGGIAKGFAADRALEVLGDRGITVAMVVAGGEMALGDPPPGRCGWRVGIAPLADETPRTIPLELARAGVSTSGDAEQWMEVDGVRYSHILDPRIGEPLTERVSVTVVAPDAMTSDMLATAVAVLGERDGLALVDEYGSAAVVTTAGGQSQSTRWALDGSGAGRDPCDEHPSEQ